MLSAFKWNIVVPDEKEERIELGTPYEDEIDYNQLPYTITPIYNNTTDCPSNTVIGYLKSKCVVLNKNMKRCDEEIDELKALIGKTPVVVVRVCVLSAHGLVPRSGSSTVKFVPFLYLHVGDDRDDPVTAAFDISNTKLDTHNPDFYRSFQFKARLPHHSLLHVSVMNKCTHTHECLGTSIIDIEDRYFHPQAIMRSKKPKGMPIEFRTLHDVSTSGMSLGAVRGWCEVIDPNTAAKIPMEVVSTPEAEPFQLRVVIWRARNVPLDEESTVSIFLRSLFTLDDGTTISQDTDTHWHSNVSSTGVLFLTLNHHPCSLP
eukprot:GHVR01066262.1.p1 GENE.GHVR01066262.1~~GHVR01066262.1.p1  ORF type:complete len:317 (+),score=58.97 GHVR01066262.1:194-1144(+)